MKKYRLGAFVAAIITFSPAWATDYPAGNVTFNGSLSSTTCTVSLSGQTVVGNTVTLPFVSVAAFPPVTGDIYGGSHAPFLLNIQNCNNSIGSLQIMFEGQVDPAYSYRFMNTATTNPATNIGLLLVNQGNFVLSPNQPSPVLGLTGGAVSLPLDAVYMQINQAVAPTEGRFLVSTTLNIVY